MVNVRTGHSLTQPKMIYSSNLPLRIRWVEGSHIYKINGTYYMSVAEGELHDPGPLLLAKSYRIGIQVAQKSCTVQPFIVVHLRQALGRQIL